MYGSGPRGAARSRLCASIALCSALAGGCGESAVEPVGPTAPGEEQASAGADEPRHGDDPTPDGESILVDASRDGGVWWYPQSGHDGGFDPEQDHQGSALAGYLRERGYRVDELPRPHRITRELLDSYEIVIRANAFSGYTAEEVASYEAYVDGGGALLLLNDHMRYAAPDQVGAAFGIVFEGITRGVQLFDELSEHAITKDVGALVYGVGSAIVEAPEAAAIVGRLSANGYADLDFDEVLGPGDIVGPAVLGAVQWGRGRIVFSGDTNMWEAVPLPLVANVLEWLGGS